MKSLPKNEKVVSISQAAEILGVSIDTIRRWDKEGILHSTRDKNNVRFFSVEELEKIKFAKPLSISDAASHLGISQSTLRRLEKKGVITPSRNETGERVYSKEDLEKFLASEYFLRQKEVEEKILEPLNHTAGEEPAKPASANEADIADQAVIGTVVTEHHQEIVKLLNFKKMFYVAGLFVATAFILTITILTILFLMFPQDTAKFFGLGRNKTLAQQSTTGLVLGAKYPSEVLGARTEASTMGKILRPFGNVALGVVGQVSPETYNKIVPKKPIEDVNDIFSIDDNGSIKPYYNVTFPDTSYLIIPDKGLITNLNADYIRGRVPGDGEGNLVVYGKNKTISGLTVPKINISGFIVTSADIADGSVTSSDLGEGSVTTTEILDGTIVTIDLADGSVTTVKLADGAVTSAKITDGTISNSDISDSAGISDGKLSQITAGDKVAGSAVQLNSSGGLVNASGLSLTRTCAAGQNLAWDGSSWLCNTPTVGSGDITGVTAGDGLSGGGASGDVTLDIGAGSGIIVSANSIAATLGTSVDLTSEVTGILPVLNGGTNASSIGPVGSIAYSTGTAYGFSLAGVAGQCLQSGGGASPTWGTCGTGTITAVGDITSGPAFTQTAGNDGNTLYFEGTTSDSFETALTAADPGSDITVTIPNIAGTLASLAGSQTFSGLKTFGAGLIVSAGQTFTLNGDAFTDLTGSGLTITGGVLETTLGASVDLASEVTGVLPVTNGGTGATTFTTNGLLYGNGTGAIQNSAAGTSGQLLVANGAGVPTFVSVSADATLAASGALTLATVNANVGTFGSATQVPQVTVDGKGRITAVSNVTISGTTPGGAAGGDLSGTYPNPTVARINGATLGTTTATAGNILIGSGTQWQTQALSGDATLSSVGVLTLENTGTAGTYGSASQVPVFTTDAQGRVTSTTNTAIAIDASAVTSGTLPIARGGTNSTATPTAGAIAYGTGTAYAFSTAGSAGQCLVSGGAGTPTWTGCSAGGTITAVGDVTSGVAFDGTQGNVLQFEGSVADGFETALTSVNATADNTINLPNASGTVAVSASGPIGLDAAGNITCATCVVSGGSLFTVAGSSGSNQTISQGDTLNIAAGAGITTTGSATDVITIASTLGTSVDLTTEVTGLLPVGNGGTGVGSLTTNGVLYGGSTVGVTAAGTSGQILQANGSGVPTFVTVSSDASVAAGGALTLTTVNSNVGTFGSATQVPQVTVDGKGRITGVTNVTISGTTPGGAAGGDLSGTYPNPTVARINGATLGTTTATSGNVLIGDGSSWVTRALSGDVTVSSTGVTTIGANTVALETDTTGSFVEDITSGSGVTVTGGTGESSNPSLALGPLTANWDQTGAFDIILNNAGSELRLLESAGDTFYGTLDVGDLSADATYTLSGTSGTILTSANYTGSLDSVYVNVGESPAAGDITGSFSGGLNVGANTVALGTDTVGDYVASFTAGGGLTGDATGEGSTPTLAVGAGNGITVNTNDVTLALQANKGLEVDSNGLSFIDCATNQVLKYNGSAQWACAADDSGSGTTFLDSVFRIQDNADPTKQIAFEASGITAGTTRTFTAPNVNGTLITTGNLTDITAVGTVTSGTWNASTVTVPFGGTGAASFTTNGVVYGSGTGALGVSAAGTAGQVLLANGSGVPTFTTIGTDATVSGTGALTIAADAVALGTDTTGAYVSTITSGNGISATATGETSTPTISLAALTADWNQTGAFDISLNNAASELKILESAGGAFFGILDAGDLSADRTVTIPNASGTIAVSATGPIVLSATTGDISCPTCAVSGGTLFTAAGSAGVNQTISQGDTLTLTAGAGITTTGSATDVITIASTLGASVDLTTEVTGLLPVGNGGTGVGSMTTNGVLYGGSTVGVTAAGTSGQILQANGSGVPTFVTVSSDATIAAGGALTIAANAVALETDTTGSYVEDITSGNGINVSGGTGESSNPTVALSALTADWNQTGAFNISLNNSGSSLEILENGATPTFFGEFDVTDLTADRTYTLPNASGTVAVSASGPIVLNATTGDISCPTCLASGGSLFSSAGDSGTSTVAQGQTLTIAGGTNGIDTVDNTSRTVTPDFYHLVSQRL